jgi:hypothetical protein
MLWQTPSSLDSLLCPPSLVVLQYGNDGRAWVESQPDLAACTECTKQETGYSFSWQFTNDNYSVPSISPVMANASTDCLAKYSQTLDGAW